MAETTAPPEPSQPAAPAGAEILVLVAHPELEQSRANRRMLAAARALQDSSPPGRIAVRDLYALYPDYLIDIPEEQAALRAARLVVWQQPIHWYGMPPLLKLWLDDVLSFGWAYGPTATPCAARTCGWSPRRAARKIPTGPTATTATSSTPSCHPTSRPPPSAACASCRR